MIRAGGAWCSFRHGKQTGIIQRDMISSRNYRDHRPVTEYHCGRINDDIVQERREWQNG